METPLTGSCQCGAITFTRDTPALAKLQAGILDDTSSLEPEVYIWASTKQPWVTLPERARPFDTQPDDAMALLQAALDYRERV